MESTTFHVINVSIMVLNNIVFLTCLDTSFLYICVVHSLLGEKLKLWFELLSVSSLILASQFLLYFKCS